MLDPIVVEADWPQSKDTLRGFGATASALLIGTVRRLSRAEPQGERLPFASAQPGTRPITRSPDLDDLGGAARRGRPGLRGSSLPSLTETTWARSHADGAPWATLSLHESPDVWGVGHGRAGDVDIAAAEGLPKQCRHSHVARPWTVWPRRGLHVGREAAGVILVRVRFDDQIFVSQSRGGISRYFVELIREFTESRDLEVEPQLGWRWIRNAHALEAGLGGRLRVPGGSMGHVLRWANRAINLRRPQAALTHHTYYRAGYLSRRSTPPMVVTVYDMTPELFPELFSLGNPHLSKREYVRRATLVLCISESTRSDLIRIYGSVQAPVIVSHLGVSHRFAPGALRPAWCPGSYVLFIGNRGGYKDFRIAMESFAEVAPRQRGTALVAVGGGVFTSDEEALISRWGLRDIVFQRSASDEELPGVFGGARAFVFPSRYEGFGLPTLEAMACGTPTVLANSSSHPEVGGDAALYFPQGDSSALAAQLERLLSDNGLRRDLSQKGIARAASFTWRRTAEATAAAYRMAVRP